jgi:hypothetical protein
LQTFPEFYLLINKLEDMRAKESNLVTSISQAYFAVDQLPATCKALK